MGNTCVACIYPGDCDDSQECTAEICDDNQCGNPARDRGDPCSDGVCNGTGTCVDCTLPQHCVTPPLVRCVDDHCVECASVSDCNDAKACTTDGCSAAGACTNVPVERGVPAAGCSGYCDGEGGCVQCTGDEHCAGYGDCYTCQSGTCAVQQLKPCVAYECSDYVWGLVDDGNRTTCYAYSDAEVTGSCDSWGGCSAVDVATACGWYAWQGDEIANCESACAKPTGEQYGCVPGSSVGDVFVSDFCVTSGQTAACSGRTCGNYPSYASQFWWSCTWWGGCQQSTEHNCGNHRCFATGSNDAACDLSCGSVGECVDGPVNVAMTCESNGQCCERGSSYTQCD
jgi:hypothetical protein